MSDNNKSYRIRTNVGEDNVLNVNLNQDFNVLEVLSLKIDTDNLYRFHTSDYGCIAGRVLANGSFGIPNAKISIFIAVDNADSEDDIISYLYPYKTTSSKNSDRIRYNLLPEDQLSDCHRNVGTFPSKRTVLDDNHVLEVYDKYYKYTTRSNEAGDYMIFGVPVGSQTIHVDIDLSDIGILSQRPRDMIYKGYNITQFENGNMFKKSENLDILTQIISQNQNVYVYPFWGEDSEGEIAITRRDIEVQYDFTPTCVFIGSVITDEPSNGISKRCIPSERMGKMDRLTTGSGTIEMIRKTPLGTTEEVVIQGNMLIDGNGTWCYQIPMNLDYVKTDEFGHTVPTDDPTRGIATRACVRFRVSLTEFENEAGYSHISKVLVPHNPEYYTDSERGKHTDSARLDYVFGTNTDDASFKNLFANNVYTVKSFIPRFQMLNIDRNKRFSGIKAVNVNENNNPIPYNNIRVDLTFMFVLQCAIFKILLWIIGIWNWFISLLYKALGDSSFKNVRKSLEKSRCLYIGEGYCPQMEGWYFAPNCTQNPVMQNTLNYIREDGQIDDNVGVVDTESIDYYNEDKSRICLSNKIDYFVQCVEINLAMEYEVIQFDFYNDWLNGALYVPRWFADIRPKRSYFFGLIKIAPRVNGCMEGGYNAIFSRRYTQQCALTYGSNGTDYTDVTTPPGCDDKKLKKQKCHKAKGRKNVKVFMPRTKPSGGVVHDESVSNNKTVYYFRPCIWLKDGKKCNFFATDIVLLGSLIKDNPYGIPQTFEKLSSTSYQIPDTIASTNIGVEGFLYGNSREAICDNWITDDPVNRYRYDNTTEAKKSIKRWTNGKDFYEAEPYDDDEDIVTEAAGIDWGFWGPGQEQNTLDHLYHPGGHFLGISCVNAETNIKSCVNLSRICEVGSIISQRQTLIQREDNNGYSYRYLIPTGLISGESINDYGFKNEFATLNYNKLRIKKNEDTLLNEYDFETIYPVNFNGELSHYVMNDALYNSKKTPKEYVRTIEENSSDYYRFRLGLPANRTLSDSAKRFLYADTNEAYLPVFENSFYFYFGIKSGNTAIDRFFKDFYAECPEMNPYEPDVIIETITKADFCNGGGEARITLKNIEEPTYSIWYDNAFVESGKSDSGVIVLNNLTGNETIRMEINGANIVTVNRTFSVDINYPESIEELTYEKFDYTVEKADFHTDDDGAGGIKFTYDSFSDENVYGVGIVNPDTGRAKIIKNANYDGSAVPTIDYEIIEPQLSKYSLDGEIIYAWIGNSDYTILLWYACGDEVRTQECGVETITMPADLDIIFDGYKYASYRYLIAPILDDTSIPSLYKDLFQQAWYSVILHPGSDSSSIMLQDKIKAQACFQGEHGDRVFNLVKYHLKKALFYRNSQSSYDNANGEIIYREIGGTPPYTTTINDGYGEKYLNRTGNWVEGEVTALYLKNFTGNTSEEAAEEEGYDLSTQDFHSPTLINTISGNQIQPIFDAPLDKTYFKDYYKLRWNNGNERVAYKYPYEVKIADAAGETTGIISMPSIYRPFYFRAMYLCECKMVDGQHVDKQKFSFGVANPVCEIPALGNSDNVTLRVIYSWFNENSERDTGVIHEYTYDPEEEYNGPIDGVNNRPAKIEKNYFHHCFEEGDNTAIRDGAYGVAVSEDNGETISDERSVQAYFIGDGVEKYDIRVKYLGINEALANAILHSSGNPVYDDNNMRAYFIEDDKEYLPFYSYSSTTSAHSYAWTPNLSSYIIDTRGQFGWFGREKWNVDPQEWTEYQLRDENYEANIRLLAEESGFTYILGVYESDPTENSTNRNALDRGVHPGNLSLTDRHTTHLSVLRVYDVDSFIDYVRETFHSYE